MREKARDDTQVREALRNSVVVKYRDLPCLWPQPVPCKNLGLFVLPDGMKVCEPHYDRFFGQAI